MTNRIQYRPTKIKNYFNLCLDADVFGTIFLNMNDEFTVIIKQRSNITFKKRIDALEFIEFEFRVRYWHDLHLSDNYKFFRPRFRCSK